MEILASAITIGVFVGIGYLYLRSYWVDEHGHNSELSD